MIINRALAERIERQFVGMPAIITEWLASHPQEQVAVAELAGGWVVEPLLGAHWGGGGFGLGFTGDLTEAEYATLLGAAERVGARFRVVVCPYCDMALPRRLIAEGFALEGLRTVLVRAAPTPEELAPWAPGPGVDIRRIDPRTELDLYTDTVTRGFNEGSPQQEVDRRMARISQSYSGVQLFLATVEGVPAGGGRVDCAGGVAYFMGGSVLPEFRNRGVHRALLAARMAAAARSGCDLLTIGSLAGGATERNAQRLGFEVAYTSLELLRGPI